METPSVISWTGWRGARCTPALALGIGWMLDAFEVNPIGNLGAPAGGGLAALGLDRLGRTCTVTGSYGLACLSRVYMGIATAQGTAIPAAFVLARFCASGSWIAAYPTFAESFPIAARGTGIGSSVAVGRIGAAVSPPCRS